MSARENDISQQEAAGWWYALTDNVQRGELAETWKKPSNTHHPQQVSVFVELRQLMQFKTTRVICAAIRFLSIESWHWGQLYDLGVYGRG